MSASHASSVCIYLVTLVALATHLLTSECYADETILDHLAKPSLNVVITVSDMAAAKQFYGEVLGLQPMPSIHFSDKTAPVFFPKAVTMERFRVGTHEIKLIPGVESTKKHPGGVATGIGIRMVNYPIPDFDAFKQRLKAHGYPEPTLGALPDSSYRFGMLEDPDGNQVEFFFHEGEGPGGWQETLQIALTVSDVQASRRFYGEVLGMQELPAIPMPGATDRMIYLFRNGPTLIKFWSFGGELPNYAGRHLASYGNRYIQYHTKNAEAARRFVESRGATIDLSPTAVQSMPVDIMFVADPDGIINEMFSVGLRLRSAGAIPNAPLRVRGEPNGDPGRLFDGMTLNGWTTTAGRPITKGWSVVDGMIRLDPSEGRAGHIVTEREYGDFDLSFEWKIAKGGNSGVKYRVRKYFFSYYGCEYQILDDNGYRRRVPPRNSTGSIYDLYEPNSKKRLRPPGEFNVSRIVVQGNRIQHWLNGELIVEATVGNKEWEARVASSKFSDKKDFGKNPLGKIMLTDHGSEIWFRNIHLQALETAP